MIILNGTGKDVIERNKTRHIIEEYNETTKEIIEELLSFLNKTINKSNDIVYMYNQYYHHSQDNILNKFIHQYNNINKDIIFNDISVVYNSKYKYYHIIIIYNNHYRVHNLIYL